MIRTVANMKYGQNVADFLSAHLPADYSFNADALNTEPSTSGIAPRRRAHGRAWARREETSKPSR